MDELKPLSLLITSGLLIRYSLVFTGQAWAKSHSQTVAFLLLPVITYIITKTISGNIALSLGMIGALSIVRFRHPVKSALELVVYFDLITLGIATSVRTKWAIQLVLCTLIIIFSVKVFQKIFEKFNRSFYNSSFNEGNSTNTIEITSNKKNTLIENNKFLVSFFEDLGEKQFVYRLNFENRDALLKFKKDIESEQNILQTNTNFN